MPVLFPFYVDSTTEFPDWLEAYMLDSLGQKHPLDFSETLKANAIRMHVPLQSNKETTWYLNYEQKIGAKQAVYIITTTAAWQKPLKQATYTFITPKDFSDIKVWPEPDTTFEKNNQTYRQCVKYDFMPARNMQINWK